MNDLVKVEQHLPQTAAGMRAHVNLIQEVMKAVMIGPSKENPEGVHYGIIPGTKKKTLYKAGAEVLCATFHIAPSYRVEELSGSDFVRYRVTCVGTHQASGTVMGEGLGECSSMEEKYKWRKATANREFDNTAEDRRRFKYGWNASERREYEIKQVRTEQADLANTILKMACKRSLTAMTLNVLAASDIFSQDIEDLQEELRPENENQDQPTVQQPKSKSAPAAAAPATPPPANSGSVAPDAAASQPMKPSQCKIISAKLKNCGLTQVDLDAAFPSKCLIPTDGKTMFAFSEFETVSEWIEKNRKG